MNISKTWDVDPMAFAKGIEDDVPKLVVKTARMVFTRVVAHTPVFTGNLRASWVVSTTESNKVVTGGSKDATLPPPRFPEEIAADKPEIIYVMNSTPYAGLVEFGGPKNIPRAMVQKTLSSL